MSAIEFCLDCNGSGVIEDFDGTVDHAVCNGTGYKGLQEGESICGMCGGYGYWPEEFEPNGMSLPQMTCTECNGDGTVFIDITPEELEAALRGILTRVLHQIEEKK